MTTQDAPYLPVRSAIPKTIAIKGARTAEDFAHYDKSKKRKLMARKAIRGTLGILGLLIAWHLMSVAYDLQLILPTPWAVLRRVAGMLMMDTNRWLYGPDVYTHLAVSFQRAMIGFGLAAILAIPLGLLIGSCFGAKGLGMFYYVVLPATVPHITTGMRIALGGAWRMIVAGEMLASSQGIGYMLMEARFHFRAVDLMTAMILISIIGYLTELLIVRIIEKRTVEKWEVKPT